MTPSSTSIPFNRSSLEGRELEYIFQTITIGQIAGDQTFSKKCHRMLEETLGVKKALVTTWRCRPCCSAFSRATR